MTTEVVTICNRIPDKTKEPYYHYDKFLASLKRFDSVPTVLGMGEWWGGLMTKPRRLRQWLRHGGCESETLIVCDAFDVIFSSSPNDIASKWGGNYLTDRVMFNAEKGLFPRRELEASFPTVDGSPWKYLNSGVFIGKPLVILEFLESMWLDDISDDHKAQDELHGGHDTWVNPNDQGVYQTTYSARRDISSLDTKCDLLQTLSACELSEFDVTRLKFKNIFTGTYPDIWHFNGGAKDLLLPTFLASWGL